VRGQAGRHVPAAVKRWHRLLFDGLCSFPGCHQPIAANHHTQRFALCPSHDPDLMGPLCEAHHQMAHRGLIEREEALVSGGPAWLGAPGPGPQPRVRLERKIQTEEDAARARIDEAVHRWREGARRG
jgi:hypothetical protein